MPSSKLILIRQRNALFKLIIAVMEESGRNPSESGATDARFRETELRSQHERVRRAITREFAGGNPIGLPSDTEVRAMLDNIAKVDRLTKAAISASTLIDLIGATLAFSKRIMT